MASTAPLAFLMLFAIPNGSNPKGFGPALGLIAIIKSILTFSLSGFLAVEFSFPPELNSDVNFRPPFFS